MKKILSVIFLLGFYFVGMTQCEETISGQSLEKNMFLFCFVENEPQINYVAEVISVDGNSFSCRFLHTQSIYEFIEMKRKDESSLSLMQAMVKSNKGGKFPPNTIFYFNVYMVDPDVCDLTNLFYDGFPTVIATFPDNKSYLGKLMKTHEGYKIKFAHTNSVYKTNNNLKVISHEGGGYTVGSQMKVVNARLLKFDEEVPWLLQERN